MSLLRRSNFQVYGNIKYAELFIPCEFTALLRNKNLENILYYYKRKRRLTEACIY